MAEILNFKKGATIIKLNATVTLSHCGRDKNMENKQLCG
jgi:hypothetical protein